MSAANIGVFYRRFSSNRGIFHTLMTTIFINLVVVMLVIIIVVEGEIKQCLRTRAKCIRHVISENYHYHHYNHENA